MSLDQILANPEVALQQLERLDCEDSLLSFMTQGWHALEPAQPFVAGWAVEAICEHLEAVTRGEITRLLINVPPGCTKSMTTSVFWPMWEWGPQNMPQNRIITIGHDQTLPIRDHLRSRDLANSEWYQRNWGAEWSYTNGDMDIKYEAIADRIVQEPARWSFKGDQNAKVRYENDKTGWRQASSTGSGLTGHRGDRIILDDPHAVRDMESEAIREDALRWFSETLQTRLNNADRSAIVVIMQRVHQRDVSGLILAEDLGYEHLCLPMEFEEEHRCFTSVPRVDGTPKEQVTRVMEESDAIPRWMTPEQLATAQVNNELMDYTPTWQELYPQDRRIQSGDLLWPERFGADAIESLKKSFRSWGGTYAEAGQLQQRPSPRGGGMFQRKDFQFLEQAPPCYTVCRGWDLAATKDGHGAYTVGLKLGKWEHGWVILDVVRGRWSPGEVNDNMLQTANQDGMNVMIDFPQDPGQAGKSQKSAIGQLLAGFRAYSSPESGDKADRARPVAAQSELGNLYIVRGTWNDALINELCLFPNGEFKDQADALSRAFMRLNMQPEKPKPAMPSFVSLGSL